MSEKERKRIGIVGWKVGDNSIGITQPYYEFFNYFGDVEILSPNHRVRNLDLLVLPGGGDVNPVRYGQAPRLFTGNANPILEWFDVIMLPKYISKNIPIFGICRGLQTLNVHFGGTLKQHSPHEHSTDSRDDLVHGVHQYLNLEEFGYNPNLKKQFRVNSLHHQSIDKLGKDLNPTAIHTKDMTIEGVLHKTLPIAAVQWHPEEIYDEFSIKTISHLLTQKKEVAKVN
jgi:gamma-glutamyl-gamma-aminobutyrate hydrolase PuuD